MKQYVVGFAFDEDERYCLLIRKNYPDWQEGKLNGLGGHVEPFEKFSTAMAREFLEEAGIQTAADDWRPVIGWHGVNAGYTLRAFRTTLPLASLEHKDGEFCDEGELILVDLGQPCWWEEYDYLENLYWLLPLAHKNPFMDYASSLLM
jgi:8-oxo-dGTP pyrophosphatase MutT (NUDIX family)